MEGWSLAFTILTFIVACLSLWMMWRIDQTTSKFAKERAKKEDLSWDTAKAEIKNVAGEVHSLGILLETDSKKWASESDLDETNEYNK